MAEEMSKEEKKALKEKLKKERQELRKAKKLERKRKLAEEEDKNPLKFKEWCSLKGVRSEIKKISWLSKEQLAKDTAVVLAFTVILSAFFYLSDIVIAFILKALGMS